MCICMSTGAFRHLQLFTTYHALPATSNVLLSPTACYYVSLLLAGTDFWLPSTYPWLPCHVVPYMHPWLLATSSPLTTASSLLNSQLRPTLFAGRRGSSMYRGSNQNLETRAPGTEPVAQCKPLGWARGPTGGAVAALLEWCLHGGWAVCGDSVLEWLSVGVLGARGGCRVSRCRAIPW